ncbi:MAG: glycosyltransferase family 9 protein [Bacteroidetes bacterium]|nr:glycosyltransferase family 9 protein [Bacteroidota bacterium]
MKVLVIRFSAMGDVAMTSPVVAFVASQNPEIEFTVLTQDWLSAMYTPKDNLKVRGVNLKNYKGLKGLHRLFKELSGEGYDIVIDLHDVLRTKILRTFFLFKNTPIRVIDKGRKEKKALIKSGVKKQLKTTVERYRETFEKAGFHVELPMIRVQKQRSLPSEIESVSGKKEGKWYGVAPFAQHQGKKYPLNYAKRLIELLSKEENDRVFVFSGGGEEKQQVEEIIANIPNAIAVFGRVRIAGELALMSNLDCVVSMDSGAMHMASIVGTRCVSIWGATHPHAGFLGWLQLRDDAISLNKECSPCSIYGNKPCKFGTYECMTEITPEMVASKVL